MTTEALESRPQGPTTGSGRTVGEVLRQALEQAAGDRIALARAIGWMPVQPEAGLGCDRVVPSEATDDLLKVCGL